MREKYKITFDVTIDDDIITEIKQVNNLDLDTFKQTIFEMIKFVQGAESVLSNKKIRRKKNVNIQNSNVNSSDTVNGDSVQNI